MGFNRKGERVIISIKAFYVYLMVVIFLCLSIFNALGRKNKATVILVTESFDNRDSPVIISSVYKLCINITELSGFMMLCIYC